MGRILQSKVIYKGNIIDNYLANFPQFINKQKDSIYKLVIGQKVTCFVVNVPEDDYIVNLPYFVFGQNHAQFISWGDEITKKKDDAYEFISHTYKKAGIYQIYILGDTPELYGVYDFISSISEEQKNLTEQIIYTLNAIKYYGEINDATPQVIVDEVNRLKEDLENMKTRLKQLAYHNEHLGLIHFLLSFVKLNLLNF